MRAAVRLCNCKKRGRSFGETEESEGRDAYQGECTIVDELIDPGGRPGVLCGQPSLDECGAIVTP